MPLLFKIYLSCVVGACVLIILMEIGKKKHKRTYTAFDEGQFAFKVFLVAIPVLNLLASFFAIIIIGSILLDLWSDFGLNITIRLTKKNRYFRIKELLVRILFREHIDIFYKLITSDLLGKIKKALKDEKAKHQSKSETHIEPAGENQKASIEGESNNPA